jgi:Auxiliary Activity family 9 (formerly GH61)
VCYYTIDNATYDGQLPSLTRRLAELGNSTRYLWHIDDLSTGDPLPDPPETPSIQRRWDYNPILDPTSPNMIYNFDGAATASSLHAPIAVGSNITAHWNNFMSNVFPDSWNNGDGPLFAYMAACPADSCEDFDGSRAVWFKIDQIGLAPRAQDLRGPWMQELLLLAGNRVTPGYPATILTNLRPGNI